MNIKMLKRIAERSDHKLYQHVSLIFAGSRLLSYGYNRGDLHSEVVAIRRLNALTRNHKRKPTNLHMVNFMIKRKTGNIGNSCPCSSCMVEIVEANIKTVTCFYYNQAPIQIEVN